MIPPSLLSISYYFTSVPIFESEPVEPPAPSAPTAPAAEGQEGTGEQANAAGCESASRDADGINDEVAMRLVLKGYKWVAVPMWEAATNPCYESYVDNRAEEDEDRQRDDARARKVVTARPNLPAAPEAEAPSEPSAAGDSGE